MKQLLGLLMVVAFAIPAWAGFRAYNGTTDLDIFDAIKCSTGITCTRVSGKLNIVSSPTVAGAEITITGAEATDAILNLLADESDDNADDWFIKSLTTGSFVIQSGATGSAVARFTMSGAGALTSVVSITGAGTGALSGYLQSQVASTSVAITAAQCGSTFVSNSADVMVLPEASTVLGCRLTFVCGTADDFDVNPADGTDVIGITGALAPSAGDAIRCTDIGAGFMLEAVGANLWAVLGTNGTITDVD